MMSLCEKALRTSSGIETKGTPGSSTTRPAARSLVAMTRRACSRAPTAAVRAASDALPYRSRSQHSCEHEQGPRDTSTMMIPPPTPLVVRKSSLSPNIFELISIVMDSSSVQAGEQAQLNPGLLTELAYMSASIEVKVAFAGWMRETIRKR